MAGRWATAAATALGVALALGACATPATSDPLAGRPTTTSSSTSTTTPATTTTSSTTIPPTSTTAVVPVDPDEALLLGLLVEPEHLEGYDRDRFEHWTDADGDGCRTRCEVLEAERRTDLPPLASGWFSIYDGFVTDDPARIEIDHVVALAEAWRSGAWAWDDARREAFANDLDEPGALVAVSSASNQSKADKDPAEWRPSRREAWCEWSTSWVRVKARWRLSVDDRELTALRQLLADC